MQASMSEYCLIVSYNAIHTYDAITIVKSNSMLNPLYVMYS